MPATKPSAYIRPYAWQREWGNAVALVGFWILNATTGSGKSIAVLRWLYARLEGKAKRRAIVAVPQTTIRGWEDEQFYAVDNKSRHHYLEQPTFQNLLNSSANDSGKVACLLDFLSGPLGASVQSRILVCTHATLAKAFAANPTLFKNVDVVIDEAHHIMYGANDVTNCIGRLVKYACENRTSHIGIGLVTATYSRGDKNPIIPKQHLERFHFYKLTLHQYMKECCRHLQGLKYDFILYEGHFSDELTTLFREDVGRVIAYIPHPNTARLHDTAKFKAGYVKAIIEAIAGSPRPRTRWMEDGVILQVKHSSGRWINVVDLVDDDSDAIRQKRKRRIDADDRDPNGGNIDVIIALNLIKEGANWRWANRELIFGTRNSLTDVIQMVGRLLRDAKGKKHVEVLHFLPLTAATQQDRRDTLDSYLTAYFQSLVVEDVFVRETVNAKVKTHNLEEAIPEHRGVLRDIFFRVLDLIDMLPTDPTSEDFERQFKGIAISVLQESGRVKRLEIDGLAENVWRMWKRHVKGVKWNLPQARVPLALLKDFFLGMTSGLLGVDDIRALQKTLQRTNATWMERYEDVKRIGIENLEVGSAIYEWFLEERRQTLTLLAAQGLRV